MTTVGTTGALAGAGAGEAAVFGIAHTGLLVSVVVGAGVAGGDQAMVGDGLIMVCLLMVMVTPIMVMAMGTLILMEEEAVHQQLQ